MIQALCLLCGSRKETVESTCAECGHAWREDEAELARLFSSAHLSQEELEKASVRIASGERPAQASHPQSILQEAGVSPLELSALFFGCLLLTPLYGLVMSWGWRSIRPRAARQALGVAAAVGSVLAAFWAAAYLKL
ncbi:MAG: hypothetical protein VXW32_01305 [Myxococcota bacterium]|nr:hypothetical protein [Myxococcota bacterium]